MKRIFSPLLAHGVMLFVFALTGCPQGGFDPSPSPSPSISPSPTPAPVTISRIDLLIYTSSSDTSGTIIVQIRDASGTSILTSASGTVAGKINDWVGFDVPDTILSEGTGYMIFAQRSNDPIGTGSIAWCTSVNGYPGEPSQDIGSKRFCFRTYEGNMIDQESARIESIGWGGAYSLYTSSWWGQGFIPGN